MLIASNLFISDENTVLCDKERYIKLIDSTGLHYAAGISNLSGVKPVEIGSFCLEMKL